MADIIVTIFSKNGNSLQKNIQKLTADLSEKHTNTLADATKVQLDKSIEDTRIRTLKPTGNHLKDSIEKEKIEGGYGVGNFETLNQKTPWWAWINYGRAFSGREIPPGTDENPAIRGHFEPNVKGIFTKGSPKFVMNPKKPIPAHNYIEKALAFMYNAIKTGGLLK